MRFAKYQSRVLELQESKRKYLKNDDVFLDKVKNDKSTKYDLLFFDLKKNFFSKRKLDKLVDKIKFKINDLES
jgi:hypothetical protein